MGDLRQFDIEAGSATTKQFLGQVDTFMQTRNTLTELVNSALEQWHGKSRSEFEIVWQAIDGQIIGLKEQLQAIHDHLSLEIQQIQDAFSN